tara:strand:+ start:92 stop:532 length:441 start_codon:yes stop_codon:yes gene_type:complete
MDLFHKIMELVDKNSDKIPEGDYLELCDTIHELRRQVKPPSFLLNQNQPLMYAPMTDGQPPEWIEDSLPSDPDTAAQRSREQLHQRWRELDEEVMYPGLNQFLQELHEEWSDPVEPGAYYPPPTQGMHQHVEDGTTVAEVSMMDID